MNFKVSIINQVAELLLDRKETIAVAESVTSGNLQAAFSLAENATLFFQGGITAYNIGQKCRHLLVEPTHAVESNCVSSKVSEEMALEVNHLFRSDYGVGITGYASPLPEKNIHSLFAFLAIYKKDKILLSTRLTTKCEKPEAAQKDFANQALRLLLTALREKRE